MYVILVHGGPGIAWDEPVWLAEFDLEAGNGEHPWVRGLATMTDDPSLAMKFGSFQEAAEFWKQQSKTAPLRPDGKKNRPLTVYTIEIKRFP